jgi:GlpG protein
MRQIGTIPDENAARALSDYLLTQQIETKLEHQPGGWEVWVRDEDRVARAREELAAFTANPNDRRFTDAARAAADIRRTEEEAEEAYQRRQAALRERMKAPAARRRPVTALLIAISVTVGLFTELGDGNDELKQRLYIAPFQEVGNGLVQTPGLRPILEGQVWRLITPIFLHFGPLHLAFNMMWVFTLGGMIEGRRGSLRFLGLVLVTAAISNLAQYYIGGLTREEGRFIWVFAGRFGGMSGVVFGLFGYVWMKMRFDPELGLAMSQQTFILTLLWLVFCFTGMAGPIANAAHAGGLVVGMAVGVLPAAWRRLRD